MPEAKFLFQLFVIIALLEAFKFFVTWHPMIVGIFLIALLMLFRIKLMLGYPLLGLIVVMVYVFLSIGQAFLGLILYYVIEGLLWWGLLIEIKDWFKGRK